jgi:thiamine-phosphate pyrophosphorylase
VTPPSPGKYRPLSWPGWLRLCLLLDTRTCPEGWERLVAGCLDAGLTAVFLREKDRPWRELLPAARRLRTLTRESGAALVVSHHHELAVEVGADAVHLNRASIRPTALRGSTGGVAGGMRVLVSVHAAREGGGVDVDCTGADGALVAPVFAPLSKASLGNELGLEGLGRLAGQLHPLPVVAVGGVTSGNAGAVLGAGAAGVGVIGSVLGDDDPPEAVRRLLGAMEGRG